MIIVDTRKNRMKEIGYKEENGRTQVRFDISDIMSEFPGGAAVLIVKRPADCEGFPARLTEMDGTTLVWTATAYELAQDGRLEAQVVYTANGGVVAKTKIYKFIINDSLLGEGEEPEDWEDWAAELLEAAADIREAIDDAGGTITTAVETAVNAAESAETSMQAAEAARAAAEAGAQSAQSDASAADTAADLARLMATNAEYFSMNAEDFAVRAEEAFNKKGQPGGIADLDESGKVPSSQIPDSFNDVREYQRLSSFPSTGSIGVIYIALDTNKLYRWNATRGVYLEVGGNSLELGETPTTAFRGDQGKFAYDRTMMISTAETTDIGRALSPKHVVYGLVTEWQFLDYNSPISIIDDNAPIWSSNKVWSVSKTRNEINKIADKAKIYRASFTSGSNPTNHTVSVGLDIATFVGSTPFSNNTRVVGYNITDSSYIKNLEIEIDPDGIGGSWDLLPGAQSVPIEIYIAETEEI